MTFVCYIVIPWISELIFNIKLNWIFRPYGITVQAVVFPMDTHTSHVRIFTESNDLNTCMMVLSILSTWYKSVVPSGYLDMVKL